MIGHAMHHVRQRGALAVQLSMAALAVGLVVGAGGAWVVRGWQAGAQLQTERAAYARDLAYAEAATTRAVDVIAMPQGCSRCGTDRYSMGDEIKAAMSV